MWAEYLIAFLAGAFGHKLWRVGWRAWRAKLPLRVALVDEFTPPEPERNDRRRRVPKVTEVA